MVEGMKGIKDLLTQDKKKELLRLARKEPSAEEVPASPSPAQLMPYQVLKPDDSIWIHPYSAYADLFKNTSSAARELHLGCFLVAISQVIGSRVFMHYSRPVGVNLYVFICGPSGVAVKGTPTYWMRKLLEGLNPDARILSEVQSVEYLNEKLAEKENLHVLLSIEETSSLLAAAQRSGTKNLIPGLLRLRDLPAEFSTGTKTAKVAKEPFVSLLTTSAWEAIENYITQGVLTSGFINRCLLFCVGMAPLLPWPEDPPPKAWNSLLSELKRNLSFLGRGRVEIALSSEVRPHWIDHFNRWQNHQMSLVYESRLITSRTHLHALELAAINAILNRRKFINPEDIRWGWTLATYCQNVSLNTFSNWANTEVGRMEIRLRERLKDSPRKKRELQQELSRGGKTYLWNQVIKNLKESGELNEFTQTQPSGQEAVYLALISS